MTTDDDAQEQGKNHKFINQSIDIDYWNLHADGRDLCLSCSLDDCILGTRNTSGCAYLDHKQETLNEPTVPTQSMVKLKQFFAKYNGCPLTIPELAELAGIKDYIIRRSINRDKLKATKRKVKGKSGKGEMWFVEGVK